MTGEIPSDEAFRERVAPEALEFLEDGWRNAVGVFFLPLAVRVVGAGGGRRPAATLTPEDLAGLGSSLYAVSFERLDPARAAQALRARRTLLEAVMMLAQERLGRSPSTAEVAAAAEMERRESAAAFHVPLLRVSAVGVVAAADPTAARRARWSLDSVLRARGLLPQVFQFIPEAAYRFVQPGGDLHPTAEGALGMTDEEAAGLFPLPNPQPLPEEDALWLGRHARRGVDLFLSPRRGLDPAGGPHPHALFLILGEPGSGKSTLLRLIALQRRLQGRPVVFLDPEGEHAGLVRALGGVVMPAVPPPDPDVCLVHPLQGADRAERFLAARALLSALGIGETAAYRAALDQALAWLEREAQGDPAGRIPLGRLAEALRAQEGFAPAQELADLLSPYVRGGSLEGFFDRPRALLDPATLGREAGWVDLDLSGLREENRDLVFRVLAFLLARALVQAWRPMDLLFDEGWRLLREEAGRSLLDEIGRRARKRGAAVWVATHLPAETAGAGILRLAVLALAGRLPRSEAEAFLREAGLDPATARAHAEEIARMPPYHFLAIPGGGRGVPIPVRVELPPLWKEFLDALSPSPASGGLR
jgi:hypothetical protein